MSFAAMHPARPPSRSSTSTPESEDTASSTLDSEDTDRSEDSAYYTSDVIDSEEESEGLDDSVTYTPSEPSELGPEPGDESDPPAAPTGAAPAPAGPDETPPPTQLPGTDGAYWRVGGKKRRRTETRTYVEEFRIGEEFEALKAAAGIRPGRAERAEAEREARRITSAVVAHLWPGFPSDSEEEEPLFLGH